MHPLAGARIGDGHDLHFSFISPWKEFADTKPALSWLSQIGRKILALNEKLE